MVIKEDIEKTLEVLRSGGTILYLTDTAWAIGCDATDSKAVNKIYKTKYLVPVKELILLANSIEMVAQYVEKVPDIAIELLAQFNDPVTIIYDKPRNLPRNLLPDDNTIAMRIPKSEFCLEIIEKLGRPIVSTSANLSGDAAPLTFSKVNPKIKDAADYICSTGQGAVNSPKPSSIVKVHEDGHLQIIRS